MERRSYGEIIGGYEEAKKLCWNQEIMVERGWKVKVG